MTGVTMAVTEQRLVDIPHDFLKSFYSTTNNNVMVSGTEYSGDDQWENDNDHDDIQSVSEEPS